MKLGVDGGGRPRALGPGLIVLDWDPAPTPQKGHRPPIFGPYLWWPNGFMDQAATWYGGMLRPRRHYVRWVFGPSKTGAAQHSQFWPMYCGQTAGWIKMPFGMGGGRPLRWPHCVTWGPSCTPKRGHSSPPNFRPMSVVAKWLEWPKCHLVGR